MLLSCYDRLILNTHPVKFVGGESDVCHAGGCPGPHAEANAEVCFGRDSKVGPVPSR